MDDHSTNNDSAGESVRPLISSDLATPIYGLFGLGILYTLYLAHEIVMPIILALMTSLLLSPLVKKAYVTWRIPRVVSSLVLVMLVLAGIVGITLAVATPALKWVEEVPQGISRLLVGESEIRRTDIIYDCGKRSANKNQREGHHGRQPRQRQNSKTLTSHLTLSPSLVVIIISV